ncbi:MAG: hypothetical protein J6E41_06915 [Lachnospiraceae bacterium]|nr:hypothetical protein [Lachnospiraceae bacterium]MBP3875407.1 hypothetical protein [Lachnospiraceae bacterium]
MSITITLDAAKKHPVSPHLYGIFYEDINFSGDGGINANMVMNYSFEGVFLDRKTEQRMIDPLRGWTFCGKAISSETEQPLHENSRYARLAVDGEAVLMNLGFNGDKAYANKAAMGIKAGSTYLFECRIRRNDFAGEILADAVNDDGTPLTEAAALCIPAGDGWEKVCAQVKGAADGYGKLRIRFSGSGSLDLDCVSFMDADYWHSGDPKWRYGKLRKDLIQAIADLKPTFVRFPGGCIVEGKYLDNGYKWKNTIGELYERKSDYNLWSEDMPSGSYNQSYQIGYYEYFCLCEDLGAKPLPTLNVGLGCQIRSMQRGEAECPNIPVDSPEFQNVIDDYLDLIEFATGDPATNEWAAKRAAMGHPEPFVLDRIGIGNEQYADTYYERYKIIEKAIHDRYPDMVCVFCAGVHPFQIEMMGAPGLGRVYEEARKYKNILVDEHSYHSPEWFEMMNTRFDDYDRNGPGVFFGEYAANGLMGPVGNPTDPEQAEALMRAMASAALEGNGADDQDEIVVSNMNTAGTNQFVTALGEAAFLTGVERNSDIVIQTSYAPLYNLAECDQWGHNLIDFNPKTVAFTANYYMQKLFSNYLGTEYVSFEEKLPEHVFASVTEDADAYYLKLVNTGAESYPAEFVFPQAVSGAEGEQMQTDDLTARNDLKFYGDTDYQIVPQAISPTVTGNRLCVEAKAHSITALKIWVNEDDSF